MIKRVPFISIQDTYIFPKNTKALFIEEQHEINSVRHAMDTDRCIVIAFANRKQDISSQQETIVAMHAEILQTLKMPDESFKILVEGIQRAHASDILVNENYSYTNYNLITTQIEPDNQMVQNLLQRSQKKILDLFASYNTNAQVLESNLVEELLFLNIEDMVDTISHYIDIPLPLKHKLFISTHLLKRIKILEESLNAQIKIVDLENKIRSKLHNNIQDFHKKLYLNEQKKIIQNELGENDDVQDYQDKIELTQLTPSVKNIALQEANKLGKINFLSAEYSMIQNYLDCILDLPWIKPEIISIKSEKVKQYLDNTHYGLQDIKNRIMEYASVISLSKSHKAPILCLLGPPGVGKTSIAQSFAKCLNKQFASISLAGLNDEASIRGHRRTYVGALPGRIITAIRKAGTNNLVILLDEIDKIAFDGKGDPGAALLEVLDKEHNKNFIDHYLEIPYDLSSISFIATANIVHHISSPLRDRLEMLELPGYYDQEKVTIVNKFILPKQLIDHGLIKNKVVLTDESILYLIKYYTKEAGVRELERILSKIIRKIVHQFVKNQKTNIPFTIQDTSMIEKFLGPPQYHINSNTMSIHSGECYILAKTEAGGELLKMEVSLSNGTGRITTTGNLGRIMEESVKIAIGYLKTQLPFLRLKNINTDNISYDEDPFKNKDIFIHFPEGAIPKDGPSAGLAITLCLVSSILNQPVSRSLGCTGEITLKGEILPIGGVRDKILVALREDISGIICPASNKKHVAELSDIVRDKIKFHFVNSFEEVIALCFKEKFSIIKPVVQCG